MMTFDLIHESIKYDDFNLKTKYRKYKIKKPLIYFIRAFFFLKVYRFSFQITG